MCPRYDEVLAATGNWSLCPPGVFALADANGEPVLTALVS
jgi:hypothetical protein